MLCGRKAFPDVPATFNLPMGMQIMHQAYLFIYVMAACISTMLAASTLEKNSAAQFFRLENLIRLYVGYMIYHLSKQLNSGGAALCGGEMSFEHWYCLS